MIEGLAALNGSRGPKQAALESYHGLQCGFCTSGVLMVLTELQTKSAGMTVTEAQVRHALSGNLCRCTDYQGIVNATLAVLNGEEIISLSQKPTRS